MKRIASFLLATVIASMSVLGIAENADSATHNRRRQTTTHVRRYRTCTGRNSYRYYRGKYYRCRYNRRHR
ncbi:MULTISPECIES: hypothetical protein [unclassified Anabaena]|uniref:hypothetical protein n=1 Tax=unclassified Anabaena TaxID=2619674 RepID=UPI0014471A6F|nr:MULTISPECIES: hypothetical protein [unclassified Anabaena]MTJ55659.1 hypothetical protein [Anabaena sp. UHCC 0253]